MQNLKTIFGVILGYVMLDFVMFFMWVESGQMAQGLYIGRLTTEILKIII